MHLVPAEKGAARCPTRRPEHRRDYRHASSLPPRPRHGEQGAEPDTERQVLLCTASEWVRDAFSRRSTAERSLASSTQQLEDLQATHLKPVLHYPFATLMLSSVPELRNSIRDAVTRSLKAWMFEARETSRAVGKGALDAMEQRGRRWAARKRKDASLGLAKINGPIELGLSERHECESSSHAFACAR